MQNMENEPHKESPTLNSSIVHDLFPENLEVEIVDDGRTIRDVVDDKINELESMQSEEPFFMASLDSILMAHRRWISNLPRVKPFYAVKCNSTPAVIRLLSALGTGFDCASKGEIELALSLGVTPDKIIYAHTIKPLYHIRYAYTHDVDTMTFDNEEELLKISLCHAKAKLVLRIAVDDSKSLGRLSSKFGARLSSAGKLLERAAELGLQVIGISFHVGSGCLDCLSFKQAIADARQAFDTAKSLGFNLSLLDIGGGFLGADESQVKFEEVSEVINESLDEFFPPKDGVDIIAEPGRYFVEAAFTLAMNVIGKKIVISDKEIDINGTENSSEKTMMYYTNDGVYGSLSCGLIRHGYLKIEPYLHRAVERSEPRYKSVIWGPTCDSIDKITENSWIPELHVGDWLLIDNMGAYTVSLCTDFNSFERPRIFLIVSASAYKIITSQVMGRK